MLLAVGMRRSVHQARRFPPGVAAQKLADVRSSAGASPPVPPVRAVLGSRRDRESLRATLRRQSSSRRGETSAHQGHPDIARRRRAPTTSMALGSASRASTLATNTVADVPSDQTLPRSPVSVVGWNGRGFHLLLKLSEMGGAPTSERRRFCDNAESVHSGPQRIGFPGILWSGVRADRSQCQQMACEVPAVHR